jgi:C4-dicarboxylate-specific signal transduction histidine kinase
LNLINNSHDSVLNLKDRWVKIEVLDKDNFIEISVTDSGNGIPEPIAQKMMNPFFTTKEVGKGTGLGLSISKGLAEDHGGSLYYDPTSKNTRFVIKLPKYQAQTT